MNCMSLIFYVAEDDSTQKMTNHLCDEEPENKRQRAATKIQAVFKGYATRNVIVRIYAWFVKARLIKCSYGNALPIIISHIITG